MLICIYSVLFNATSNIMWCIYPFNNSIFHGEFIPVKEACDGTGPLMWAGGAVNFPDQWPPPHSPSDHCRAAGSTHPTKLKN